MVAENIHIRGVQVSGKRFTSQKNESRHSDKSKTLSPVSVITPRQRQITYSPS